MQLLGENVKDWIRSLTAIVLALILARPTQAQSHHKFALVLGGVELPGQHIFRNELITLAGQLRLAHYKRTIAIGNRKYADAKLIGVVFNLPHRPAPFTPENAKRRITSLITDITNHRIKSGDQIMVVFDGHGSFLNEKRQGLQPVHSVDAAGNHNFDLGHLEKLEDVAAANKVKLAVVDLSCYSGQTMALWRHNHNTCVITGSDADSVSGPAFADEFLEFLRHGHSLESTFLEARMLSSHIGYPEISTQAGRDAELKLKALDVPNFVDDLWPLHEPLDGGTSKPYTSPWCNDGAQSGSQFQKFLSLTRQVKHVLGDYAFDGANHRLGKFSDQLARYVELRHRLESEIAYAVNKKILFGKGYVHLFTLVYLKQKIPLFKKWLKSNPHPSPLRNMIQNVVAHQKELSETRRVLMEKDPIFRQAVQDLQLSPKDDPDIPTAMDKKLYRAAVPILHAEEFMYAKIYKDTVKQEGFSRKEPCADFKF